MPLKDKIFVGGVWVDTAARFSNTAGTALTSLSAIKDGEAIADIYTLTMSSVVALTGTVTVGTASPNNPYKGRVVTAVPLDGTTAVKNIIPGISLVFASSAANGNVSQVSVGSYAGTIDASGVGSGVPSAGVRHQVENTGLGLISNSVVKLLTMAIWAKKIGTVFGEVRPFAPGATEKIAGSGSNRTMPYLMKTVNVTGVGSAKIADLQVDGVTLGANSVLDLATGEELSGVGLKAITPGNGYRIIDGPLTGVEFSLSASCATNDTANILIFPSRFVQIAEDVAGVEGTYGITDVVLTQVGQAAGSIAAAGVAYYWIRTLVPEGATSESNPYPFSVALQGLESGSAGWLS